MENLIIYSLKVYFFFYLWARSEILARQRTRFSQKCKHWACGALDCGFCTTFHISWIILLFSWGTAIPAFYPFCAPVINLIIDYLIGYLRLFDATIVEDSSTGTAFNKILFDRSNKGWKS